MRTKRAFCCILAGMLVSAGFAQDRTAVIQQARDLVATAKDCLKNKDLAKAEANLVQALILYDSVKEEVIEPNELLAEIRIGQGRNEEAMKLLYTLFRPGRFKVQSYLMAIAAARLEKFHEARRGISMDLSVSEGLLLQFGGEDNLPGNANVKQIEATAWLLLGSLKSRDADQKLHDLLEAEQLFPDNPAVQYRLGLVKLEKGLKDEAKAHFLAAETLGKNRLPAMARDKLTGITTG